MMKVNDVILAILTRFFTRLYYVIIFCDHRLAVSKATTFLKNQDGGGRRLGFFARPCACRTVSEVLLFLGF
jgi:hypothetical protein